MSRWSLRTMKTQDNGLIAEVLIKGMVSVSSDLFYSCYLSLLRKLLYILAPPLPPWSSFSGVPKMLSPGLKWPSLPQIKFNFQLSVMILFVCLFLFLFCFIRPHLQHMEVPRLGVESQLQLSAYTTATAMGSKLPL